MVNAQEWFDRKYSTAESKRAVERIEGFLTLKGFLNLELLDISNQKITILDASDYPQLHELDCSNNQLTNLTISGSNKIEKEINIADTNIDGGLEYLPDEFFNVNAVASGLNLERGHFLRKLFCTGNLAKQLNDYKIEAREEIEVNELNEESIKFLEWESIFKEIKELYEQLRSWDRVSRQYWKGKTTQNINAADGNNNTKEIYE
ncbi:hypothetical protein RhiirA4_543902 [Rhizophagus irregularis]|uniref:Leucine-rich repeat domain-containing protein n=1 Tax=Rhizophagus irregularis TaxID=588596 RepID=A0A2I1GL35_9GLOM|nr:hypothetical protein RhiirA4_543902 [Rhizophagus irregularis]